MLDNKGGILFSEKTRATGGDWAIFGLPQFSIFGILILRTAVRDSDSLSQISDRPAGHKLKKREHTSIFDFRNTDRQCRTAYRGR